MSQISSILSREIHNLHCIYFYREGVFYKAYERSAYLFVKHVRSFQVKKKFIKNVGNEVVSIGFPTNSIGNYFSQSSIKEDDNEVKVELDTELDPLEFASWKKSIELTSETNKKSKSVLSSHQHIESTDNATECAVVMKIKTFPIEGKTPLDCMLFLSELKKTL